jgi:DNA repair protein RecO
VTDLVDSFALEREPNQRLYRLLRATVKALADEPSPETRARYFEAWLLRLVGTYPRRKTCPSCGRELVSVGARYFASEHRLECRRCLSAGIELSPESIRYIDAIWKLPPEEIAPPESPGALRELGVFHYRMIQEQLEKDLKSHQVLEDLLGQD